MDATVAVIPHVARPARPGGPAFTSSGASRRGDPALLVSILLPSLRRGAPLAICLTHMKEHGTAMSGSSAQNPGPLHFGMLKHINPSLRLACTPVSPSLLRKYFESTGHERDLR
jgi:hypothetical protein